MRYTNIMFDLDGTLTDPFEGITRCVQHALGCQGIDVADRQTLACFIGPPLHSAFQEFFGMSQAQASQAVADYRERFSATGMYENRLYEGIPELLAALKASGRRLFVATSKPWVFARPIVAHFGLTGYFEQVHGSEMDGQRVHKHALIAYILQEHGVAAQNTLMIGDRRFDIEGARHNGLACAGVDYGYASPGEMDSCAPDRRFASPAAIGDYLLSSADIID